VEVAAEDTHTHRNTVRTRTLLLPQTCCAVIGSFIQTREAFSVFNEQDFGSDGIFRLTKSLDAVVDGNPERL
jgi:hypothetical protein